MTTTEQDKIQTATQPGGLVAYDYGKDAGGGFDSMTSADFKIPFLEVLQKGSPECEDGNPAKREDARPGMFHDTVSDKLYQGLTIVPVGREHVWVEWVPRTSGGGFRGKHAVDSAIVRNAPRKKKDGKETMVRVTPEGNDLVETFYLYVIVLGEDDVTPVGAAVLPLTSSKIGPYQVFNTKLREFTGMPAKMPLYAFRLKLTTELELRTAGNSHNVRFTPVGGSFPASLLAPNSPAYQAAKGLGIAVTSGRATIDPTVAKSGAADAADPTDRAF